MVQGVNVSKSKGSGASVAPFNMYLYNYSTEKYHQNLVERRCLRALLYLLSVHYNKYYPCREFSQDNHYTTRSSRIGDT